MDSSLLKYDMLSPFEKKEARDFIEFLFSKKKVSDKEELTKYKSKILAVSTWTDEDLKIFEDNKNHINQWLPPTW